MSAKIMRVELLDWWQTLIFSGSSAALGSHNDVGEYVRWLKPDEAETVFGEFQAPVHDCRYCRWCSLPQPQANRSTTRYIQLAPLCFLSRHTIRQTGAWFSYVWVSRANEAQQMPYHSPREGLAALCSWNHASPDNGLSSHSDLYHLLGVAVLHKMQFWRACGQSPWYTTEIFLAFKWRTMVSGST